MELRSLTDYMNVRFSLPAGGNTIGKEHISEEDKIYLIETFPEWFVETTKEEEEAIEAERLAREALLALEEDEKPHNPFDSDPMKISEEKDVEYIETQEEKFEISNQEKKVSKKKK